MSCHFHSFMERALAFYFLVRYAMLICLLAAFASFAQNRLLTASHRFVRNLHAQCTINICTIKCHFSSIQNHTHDGSEMNDEAIIDYRILLVHQKCFFLRFNYPTHTLIIIFIIFHSRTEIKLLISCHDRCRAIAMRMSRRVM